MSSRAVTDDDWNKRMWLIRPLTVGEVYEININVDARISFYNTTAIKVNDFGTALLDKDGNKLSNYGDQFGSYQRGPTDRTELQLSTTSISTIPETILLTVKSANLITLTVGSEKYEINISKPNLLLFVRAPQLVAYTGSATYGVLPTLTICNKQQ